MAGHSFEESSSIKQGIRLGLRGYYEGNFPDPDQPGSALTFPGKDGLLREDGFERWFLERNPENRLFCLERDRNIADLLLQQVRALKLRYVSVFQGEFADFVANYAQYLTGRLHVGWLDYMGVLTQADAESVRQLIARKLLDPRAILGITHCAAPRANGHWAAAEIVGLPKKEMRAALQTGEWLHLLAYHYGRYWRELARSCGWKISPKSPAFPYHNADAETRAHPMLHAYLIGRGAKTSQNAYGDLADLAIDVRRLERLDPPGTRTAFLRQWDCESCGLPIVHTGRRGRPRKRCEACKPGRSPA